MLWIFIALAMLTLALLPAGLVFQNLQLFQAPRRDADSNLPVSILIPARDEELRIESTLRSLLGSDHARFEILVADDSSTDKTPEIVQQIADSDSRLRLLTTPKLPDGWNGKQHACWFLAQQAQHSTLLFLDADVRFSADGIRRALAHFEECRCPLVSGFPHQETSSVAERLWIPMMYFLLLGYLPLKQMRSDGNPAFGAGCGQLFIADRTVYMEVGGHSAIRGSRHDGLKLPRLFRSKGYMTDLFDAQDIARVRMYEGLSSVLVGLMKNATEGIAKMPLLLVFSTLLGIGVVLPIPAVAHAIYYGWIHQTLWLAISGVLFGVAAAVAFIPRLLIARRFGHSILDVLLHPLAVATFLMIQWYAYLSQRLGMKPPKWRGRSN